MFRNPSFTKPGLGCSRTALYERFYFSFIHTCGRYTAKSWEPGMTVHIGPRTRLAASHRMRENPSCSAESNELPVLSKSDDADVAQLERLTSFYEDFEYVVGQI